MKPKIMTLLRDVFVQVPSVPNFLLVKNGDKIPVKGLSELECSKIGAEWTDELKRKAIGK